MPLVPATALEIAAHVSDDAFERPRHPCVRIRRSRYVRCSSSTRSGCAQNEPSIQSGVSRGIGTTSMRVRPPSRPARAAGRREAAPVQLSDLGEVVGHQPHLAADERIVGEDHDRIAGDAAQLLDPAFQLVVPVVDRDAAPSRRRRCCRAAAGRRHSREVRAGSWAAAARPSRRSARPRSRSGRPARTSRFPRRR